MSRRSLNTRIAGSEEFAASVVSTSWRPQKTIWRSKTANSPALYNDLNPAYAGPTPWALQRFIQSRAIERPRFIRHWVKVLKPILCLADGQIVAAESLAKWSFT